MHNYIYMWVICMVECVYCIMKPWGEERLTVTNLETEEKKMRIVKQISFKNPHVIAKFMNKPIKA